jgi:hypothetical protein
VVLCLQSDFTSFLYKGSGCDGHSSCRGGSFQIHRVESERGLTPADMSKGRLSPVTLVIAVPHIGSETMASLDQ